MSEKLYEFLLKLYPDHFRRRFGDEALRLVRERARSEKGFLCGLRLWLDLLLDLARSLPREYSDTPTVAIALTHPVNGEFSFQLLGERSLNPALLCLSGTLSAVLFGLCVFVVAHSGGFPVLLRIPPSLEKFVQSDLTGGDSTGPYSFCMTAQRDIPSNSPRPLLSFHFAAPGASGTALIDGRVVRVFKHEQYLSIRAHVLAGDHQFVLRLDKPTEDISISRNGDFEYCKAR
jgi:hypothetical protein